MIPLDGSALAEADVQHQGVLVQKVTIDGRPHTGNAEYAETNQVDLILMSTRVQSCLSAG